MPKSAPTSTPRGRARCWPMTFTCLNFAVAVDASADVPLLAWFDLGDEWLPKARADPRPLAKNMARVETLPRGRCSHGPIATSDRQCPGPAS